MHGAAYNIIRMAKWRPEKNLGADYSYATRTPSSKLWKAVKLSHQILGKRSHKTEKFGRRHGKMEWNVMKKGERRFKLIYASNDTKRSLFQLTRTIRHWLVVFLRVCRSQIGLFLTDVRTGFNTANIASIGSQSGRLHILNTVIIHDAASNKHANELSSSAEQSRGLGNWSRGIVYQLPKRYPQKCQSPVDWIRFDR